MGGDDLGYDDEYLLNPTVAEGAEQEGASEAEEEEVLEQQNSTKSNSKEKKRKQEEDASQTDQANSKKNKSSWRVMLEAGRDLAGHPASEQCSFLWTALAHHTQMKGESVSNLFKLQPQHFYTSSESSLDARIRDAVSMKKMRKWKARRSPMIVIVCLSARRAVQVLKELANCKVRAAKLFAKHMDFESQRVMLEQQAFPIAVGTPHRLLALCEKMDNEPALHFQDTKLVVLDSHANQKDYTVCTLPDTAPDTMDLLRQQVLPQLSKRKDLQLAFF